jgi:hypothetical protein
VSPKFQLKVNGPTPPVVVAVNWTATPTSGVAGVNVKFAADSRGATTTDWAGEVTETPLLSVAVTVTLNVPAAVYEWLAGLPVPVAVSPKLQEKVNGPTPPVVVAVNCTLTPTSGVAGVNVNAAAVRRAATTTFWAGEVTATPLASVAVTVTLNVPAAVYE